MTKRTSFRGLFPAPLLAAVLLAGCGSPNLQPLSAPSAPPPPPPPRTAPRSEQFQLEPPPRPVELAPVPTAARRIAILVTERVGRAESPRRDPESESIIAQAILAAFPDLKLEVVKKGTYDEILERDFESLIQKGLEENAQVFNNLLKAGVDYFAMAEIGASELVRDLGKGKTLAERYSVHAGITVVRTDDATAIAAGNADAEGKAFRDAKTRALQEASRKLVEALKGRPQENLTPITITVDGLPDFTQAEKILKKIREIEGVVWLRDLRFSRDGSGTGVARYELAWVGSPEDLRQRIRNLDAGVGLEAVKIEGRRWNYRVTAKAESPAPAPVPVPAPAPENKDK